MDRRNGNDDDLARRQPERPVLKETECEDHLYVNCVVVPFAGSVLDQDGKHSFNGTKDSTMDNHRALSFASFTSHKLRG